MIYISILVSVYNLEKYISFMLDSLLNQSDQRFKIIICNDGSTDNSGTIIEEYLGLFREKGIECVIIHKNNGGLSSTINSMLQFVDTEYFITCDGDDWYKNNMVETVNNFINANGKFNLGIISVEYYNQNRQLLSKKGFSQNDLSTDLYTRYIRVDKIPCFGGVNIYNYHFFLKTHNHSLRIFDSRHGQNWQLLLPILKETKPILINGTCYCCLVRNDSMSHNKQSFDVLFERYNGYRTILNNVLSQLGDRVNKNERNRYYCTKICNLCFRFTKKKLFFKYLWSSNVDIVLLKKAFKIIFSRKSND